MKECSISILTVLIQEHYDQQFPPNSTNKTTKMEPTWKAVMKLRDAYKILDVTL